VRRIGLTPGCPAGIGPEVIARAVVEASLPPRTALVFFASAQQLAEGARRARVPAMPVKGSSDRLTLGRGRRAREVLCAVSAEDDPGARARPGRVDHLALASQRDALVRACEAGARGELDALVTGPVRKKALVVDGISWPGQTELCHRFLRADDDPPLMIFAGGPFLLGLATVHLPLGAVPAALTAHGLDVAVARLEDAARRIGARRRPQLIVLGVNPHAGEGGLFGREELDVVAPAIERARARGCAVRGPVPADGLFADLARGALHEGGRGRRRTMPDAVLAMHHDQGLAPYKLLVGGEGINVTWGLRVPRTSPDHGTADALAGKGKASALSMQRALELAARLARQHSRNRPI
jgi:4-hydroxythreonine-4-phosphate dehydrogenase